MISSLKNDFPTYEKQGHRKVAIKEALQMYLEDVEDYYDAVERSVKPNRKNLSNQEMWEEIQKMK